MKILYGVAGEGMGHACRSRAIIEELQKKHEVLVVAGGRSYKYLSKHFNTVLIGSYNIVYKNNTVKNRITLLKNILKTPRVLCQNYKLLKVMKSFRPDVIITDFEPFTTLAAMLHGKKCVSIDNQHMITRTNIKFGKNKLDRLISKSIIYLTVPRATHRIVTTFFQEDLTKKNTILVPPVIRSQVLKLKPKEGRHILVYQTSKSYNKLLSTLSSTKENYIVYGFEKNSKEHNIHFKDFNEDEFYKDLVSAKAVIANGSFNILTESFHLGKPVLSIPVKKQFEQQLNAYYMQQLGYGLTTKDISKETIEQFLNNLSDYKLNLKSYKKEDNQKLFDELDRILSI